MDFDSVLGGMVAVDGGWTAEVPEDWQQGRTAFGGLSAALALSACRRLVPDLPVLRSGQIAFIGPAAGELTMRPTLLRRGKSMTFMACDLFSGGVVAMRALYAFGGARPSELSAVAEGPPDCKAPDDCTQMWGGEGVKRPGFARHLDQRPAGGLVPFSGADKGDLLVWVRHRDPVAPGIEALVALGDALPPASFTRMTGLAMISTVTWGFDLFDPQPEDGSGWVLMRSTDDGVGDGYAGQDMHMWNDRGRPILKARQSVAIFG